MDLLGQFEQLILLSLVRLGDDAYGATIRRDIADRTDQDVSVGAVYTTLDRLEQKGYVSSRLSDPTPERGGRRKKFYRLEAPGAAALRQTREAYRRMAEGLSEELEAL